MTSQPVIYPPRLKITSTSALYFPYDSRKKVIGHQLKELALDIIELGYTTIYSLPNWMVMYSGIGAPVAGLGLESLFHSGIKRIFIFGVCGSFNPIDHIGQAILVTQAFSQEGTSRHYFPRRHQFQPNPSLVKRLQTFFKQRQLPFKTGRIVSTDAPFRETQAWVTTQGHRGIDYVDMETSAVLAIAYFHQREAAACHLVSDIILRRGWQPGFRSDQLEENIKKYFLPILKEKL